MGAAKKKAGKRKPDRLAEAIKNKRREVTIDGKDLVVVKWNLETSLEMMDKLSGILEKAIGSARGGITAASFMKQSMVKLIREHLDDAIAVMSHTVARENFDSVEDAEVWVRDFGMAEAVELFMIIVEQNIRPLVRVAKDAAASVKSALGVEARKALQQLT